MEFRNETYTSCSLLCTCFWGRSVEHLLQWGFSSGFNCGFPSVSWRDWQCRVPWSLFHRGAVVSDGASPTQKTAQSSDQLLNRFLIWWRKLTYKNERFILTRPVILNGLFSKENYMHMLLLTWCLQLALFKCFSVYPRLFSTFIQSSSSCKTRLHSTFTRILLHLLQVTSFSDIHFSHM